MARPPRRSPRDHVTAGEWPTGTIDDPVAAVVVEFVGRLSEAIGERSLREVEAATGVDHTTVQRILDGQGWADTRTLARLELGLGSELWPRRGRAS